MNQDILVAEIKRTGKKKKAKKLLLPLELVIIDDQREGRAQKMV